MANPILIKKSIVPGNAPTTANIQLGELAQNAVDGVLYMRKGTGAGTDTIVKVGNEQGGVLHVIGQAYAVGDMVNLDGSGFIYVCKTLHTSTVACNIAPDDAWWYQPAAGAIPTLTYNFTSDVGGTISPAVPDPLIPGHTHEHDGLTGIPDENGPYYFSVAMGSVGKPAEVQLEGFELAPVDYDLTLDGYIKILSPVADNSWLKVII